MLDEQFDLNTINYKDFNKDEILVTMESLKKHYTTLKKTIDNNNYKDHLQEEINYLKTQKQDESTKQIISLYDKLLKLNITNPSDIRIKYAEDVVNSINSKEKILSKTEYNKTDNQTSYENYVKITKKTNEDLDNKIKKSLYAIDHNIDYNKIGSRTSLNEIIINNVAFLGLIVVIISGAIVASEYQRGTIRLLVIRPNKRWKILLSKFLTITILTIVLAFITYLSSFLTTGILYGFKDYFISDLIISNGKIKEISFILLSIGKMLILLIPILFSGLIAFFFINYN